MLEPTTSTPVLRPRSPITSLAPQQPAQGAAPEGARDRHLIGTLMELQPLLQQAALQAGSFDALAGGQKGQRWRAQDGHELAYRKEIAQLAMQDLQRGLQRLSNPHGILPEPPADGAPPPNPADMDAGGLVWGSHADFYKQIAAMLGLLQTEWLSKYQDALAKYLEFYTELGDAMEMIKVVGSGDKGDVRIDSSAARAKLEELKEKYGLDANALASFGTREEAQAFIDSMGLPGLTLTPEDATPGDGTFRVIMDLTAVTDLLRDMPASQVTWDAARYNAWVSSKDSNMEQIKHVSKVLGEKLSEMTQKFDNIVKILSATIDKITEADMSFIHGL